MDIALAIVVDESRQNVLIHKRAPDVHLANLWEFPGGKIELGESPENAAIRETKEEAGLAVRAIEVWDQVSFAYAERTVTLHPFLCQPLSAGEPRGGWIWVQIAHIASYEFPAANRALVEQLIKFAKMGQ